MLKRESSEQVKNEYMRDEVTRKEKGKRKREKKGKREKGNLLLGRISPETSPTWASYLYILVSLRLPRLSC